MSSHSILAALAPVVGWTPRAAAQISSATVNCTIRDSTGRVVLGTEISIPNIEDGVDQRSAATNASVYCSANLQPGMHTVSRPREGFPTAVANPFTVIL